MQWSNVDIKRYSQAKEYIDTLFIPLIPFQLSVDNDLSKHAFQYESLTIFLNELEKELSGRVLLTPTYHYLTHTSKAEETNRIEHWVKDARKQPFDHIFFFTHDATWKKYEKDLDGSLIWIPGSSVGNVQSNEFVQLIRDQVMQISELIRSYW